LAHKNLRVQQDFVKYNEVDCLSIL
jgi:hypothetical protein